MIEDGIIIQRTLTDCTEIDSQIAAALEEQEVVTELIRKCIAQNATDGESASISMTAPGIMCRIGAAKISLASFLWNSGRSSGMN